MIALFAAAVATFAGLYNTQAILPELSEQFDISATSATLSVSLTTLGLAVALLIVGPVSDVIGRTRLIHLSLVASGVVGTACALAPGWPALMGLRLLEGITLAGLPAVATAYLREELHPSAHARAVGLYVGGTALGGMVGRLVTGSVADAWGWRWGLAAIAAVGLVCAVIVGWLLPPSQHFTPAPTGWRAVLRMGRRALADRVLVLLYLVGGCSVGALVAVFNTMGFRLAVAPFDLSLAATSLVYLVYPVGTLSSMLFGRLADAFGRRAVMPFGCLLAVGGALLTLMPSLPLFVAGLALLTAGFFAVHGVASGWVPVRAHAEGVSTAQAASLYLFTFYLGSSVFGTVAGAAWHGAGWPGVVALAVVLLGACAGMALAIRRTPSLSTSTP
jgi:YNFM family putative membrane transporter